MKPRLVESVPNISEGRSSSVINAIAQAARGEGRHVLDVNSDVDHNRSVITIVGEPAMVAVGIDHLVEEAVTRIDLTKHHGEHPRMGAVDVIPFIPIHNVSMEDCITLSRQVGKTIAEKYEIPVYLYEESATSETRQNLATIRKGEFEGFFEKVKRPEWKPDFGTAKVHPTAGVTAVGARQFLVAYNINLETTDLITAKKIAAAVRGSSGGLHDVKALAFALEERNIVQISMNLTNFKKTPILRVFEMVKNEAEHHGISVLDSEIVGMVPREAVYAVASTVLRMKKFSRMSVLEERIEDVLRNKH